VVYSVKCRRQVQKDQGGKVATVDGKEDVRQDAQDGRLGGVTWRKPDCSGGRRSASVKYVVS